MSNDHDEGNEQMPEFDDIEGDPLYDESKKAGQAVSNYFNKKSKESNSENQDIAEQIRNEETRIIQRAMRLYEAKCFKYPHIKMVEPKGKGKNVISERTQEILKTDFNIVHAFDVLYGDGEDRPHHDSFRGRVVDHEGKATDGVYSFVPLLGAIEEAGIKGMDVPRIRRMHWEWSAQVTRNNLIKVFQERVPEWDNERRMNNSFIKLFRCRRTKLALMLSKYFWLSLYYRIIKPGCYAPIVTTLVGHQHAGKSRFFGLINEIVIRLVSTEDEVVSDCVMWDAAEKDNNTVRKITGHGVVLNLDEMTGMSRADMNKMKSFITITVDNFDQKYGRTLDQPRQWVIGMTANSYEGIYRDDTGNRRFGVIIVGQTDDKDGKVQWDKDYKIVWDELDFENDFWQIMAECRDWFSKQDSKGWIRFVDRVSNEITRFTAEEVKLDHGGIRDDMIETHLLDILRKVPRKYIDKTLNTNGKNKGAFLKTADIDLGFYNKKRSHVHLGRLQNRMESLGFEKVKIDKSSGYIMQGAMTNKAYLEALLGEGYEPEQGDDGDDSATDKPKPF